MSGDLQWLRPYLIARARQAALRAMVQAGGEPTPGQLRRAIEPVLADRLPIPEAAEAASERRAEARQQQAPWEKEAARRAGHGGSPGRPEGNQAVDKR